MESTEDYKGHEISARTVELKGGRFSWEHTIDGEYFDENRDRPLGSESVMLAEAIDAAKRRIDNWEATGGPPSNRG